MSIRVMLADDHAVVRDGIKAVVARSGRDIEITGEATNGNEVVAMARRQPAEIYVLDIAMPLLNGFETAQRLKKMDPQYKVIFLSMHDDRAFVEKALRYGAKGYIVKETATEEIVRAIREVSLGRCFLSAKISTYVVQGFLGKKNAFEQGDRVIQLTAKEREILQLIAEGFTSKDIAVQLELSCNTVHVHRNNIMQKLDIHNQADLIRYAIKEGISHL